MHQEKRAQIQSHSVIINDSISAFFLDQFVIEENQQIDKDLINIFITQQNINCVITTRNNEELNFIQEIPRIIVVSELNKLNEQENHQKIIDVNQGIITNRIEGNLLYLFDNYITMLKYVICLQLETHYTSDFNNLNNSTKALIQGFDLERFFQAHAHYLRTGEPQIQRNMPLPIQIPIFQTQAQANQNN